MNPASIFHAHAAESPFGTPSPTDTRLSARTLESAQQGDRNYLPGLRPVVNDLNAYFKDEFVWLGY